MPVMIEEKRRYGEIEFIRFLMSILIVYYHLTPILAELFPDETVYLAMTRKNWHIGGVCVSAFFVLSGFFFHRSRVWEQDTVCFFLKKAVRFWPALAFSLLVHFENATDFLNLLYINTGLGVITSGSSNPASWYICNLLWLLLIFQLWFKRSEERGGIDYGACVGIVLIASSMLAHRTNSGYWQIAMEQIPFLTNGILLGVFGITIGILTSKLMETLNIYHILIRNKYTVSGVWIVILAYFVYIITFLEKKYELIYYLAVFLALLFFSLQEGVLSELLTNKLFDFLGRSSYAIYMMQFPCFYYLKKLIAKEGMWQSNPFSMVIFGVGFCIIVGIVTHLLIEIPAARWFAVSVKKFDGAKKEG